MPPAYRAKSVQDIDRQIGEKIRERRIILGLTQQQLADLIDLTYQQVHKYEMGINRIAAARLLAIAGVMDTPISFFLNEQPLPITRVNLRRERLSMELMRNFARIGNESFQEAVAQLVRRLADAAEAAAGGKPRL